MTAKTQEQSSCSRSQIKWMSLCWISKVSSPFPWRKFSDTIAWDPCRKLV